MSLPAVFDRLDDHTRGRLARREHPRRVEVALARLHHEAFSYPGWLYERKLDGVRILAHRRGTDIRLWTRNHKARHGHFPEIVEAVGGLEADDLVVDGEIVAFEGSLTSFSRLQGRAAIGDPDRARATGVAIFYYLFDLLHLAGHDTRRLALRDRKRLLKAAVSFADPLRFTPHRVGSGAEWLQDVCERGWEGLIAKRATAPYPSGRSSDWLKLKCEAGQELVVGGFTDPKGERSGFGALLVGHHRDGALRYAGKVGTGFDEATLTALRERLDDLERPEPPFADPPPERGVHWVRPVLVAEVAFTEWTDEGRLRHPRFKGLRSNKDPTTVVRET